MMKKKILSYLILGCFVLITSICNGQDTSAYTANWKSLSRHQTPEWFRDAKFGIYTHWGPNTVADENAPNDEAQWFGMRMYVKKNPVFGYSKTTFGDQHVFGYKDFIPKFKAENFNAKAWAKLFKEAGAKFAGPVAIHHDNFAMWDSKVTKWNSVKMGPHKDIVGALEKAIKAQHLHFMTSFHHGFSWDYYQSAFDYDAKDTAYSGLYTMPHAAGTPPSPQFQKLWLDKIKEVVVKYKPSLIWFDMDFDQNLPDSAQKKMFAFYYNWALKNNIKAVVSHKSTTIHKYTGVLDFERGKEDAITPYPWLTDDSMKGDSWFYQKSDTSWKSANDLICFLSDIVSKNGNLLLNVDPMADGTFPEHTVKVLQTVGKWLKINGESIYSTRPWITYGEGAEHASQSVRYTRSKNNKTVYVIVLNNLSKEKNVISLKSFTKGKQNIKSIDIINPAAKANWKWDNGKLEIEMPGVNFKNDDVKAIALRINLK